MLDPPFTIGRSPSNGIVISDYHLSGEHVQIARLGAGTAIIARDLQSTNGSMLERGGNRIVLDAAREFHTELAIGDVLRLGDARTPVTLRIVAIDAAGPAAALHHHARPQTDDDVNDDQDAADRVIASRSIIDLPTVTHQIEGDPVSAARVYKALQPLGGRLDPQSTLEATVEATFALLPRATHVAVLLRSDADKDRFMLAMSREQPGTPPRPMAPDPVRASRAVLRRVLVERAAILTANAQVELSSSESIMGGQILSMIAVPLWRGNEIIGLIQADNRHSAGMFHEGDLEVALLLGASAALAIENATLVQKLRIAEEKTRGENVYLKRREQRMTFGDIIGNSPAMKAVFAQLSRVVDTRATVCIEGETGTGKELVASAIHYQSSRRDKMFVAQNCATLPENLLESELFGHKRGAFTSADSDKKGLFEIADGGTLFLDEMGEMPVALQAKILRVLQ